MTVQLLEFRPRGEAEGLGTGGADWNGFCLRPLKAAGQVPTCKTTVQSDEKHLKKLTIVHFEMFK